MKKTNETLVGFEVEIGSPVAPKKMDKRSFLRFLKARLQGCDSFSHLKFVDDISINYGSGVEIITPPLSVDRSFALLKSLFDSLNEIDCRTNSSCGLHVNVSVPEMQERFNPFAILAEVDEIKYLTKWGRMKNKFTAPWETKLEKLRYTPNGKDLTDFDTWRTNSSHYMRGVCYYNQIFVNKSLSTPANIKPFEDNKRLKRLVDAYVEKYISISLPYIMNRGYVEYRIIGGDYLARCNEAIEDAEYFVKATERAALNNRAKVQRYARRLFDKFQKTESV